MYLVEIPDAMVLSFFWIKLAAKCVCVCVCDIILEKE